MSYSIYYDRAFIRVDDKFIPLVNSGSNNCFEFKGGREVPEKDWGVLNWKREGQVLFSAVEIQAIANDYDRYNQESGMIFKSRYRQFDPGEFERWVVGGMKNAYTIEEYRSFGNSFYILDYSPNDIGNWVRLPFTTTEELQDILDSLGGKREISIKLTNNREVYRPVNHRPRGRGLRAGDLLEYYVLAGVGKSPDIQNRTVYLVKLTRSGFRYVPYWDSTAVKVFRSEREATKYAEKYAGRLDPFAAFKPELIASPQNGGGTA